MSRYLRYRNWWLNNATEINAFKWGFAAGVTTMGFVAIWIVSA